MKTYFEDNESRKIRVHQSHCCFYHGCKYGDTDCPVLTGRAEQLYPCGDCDQRGWKPVSEIAFFDELGTMTGPEFDKAMARVEEVKDSGKVLKNRFIYSNPTIWPEDRRIELGVLIEMLNTLSSLDRGSNFLAKTKACIEMAERLTKTDIDTCRQSFVQFLIDEAHKGA